VSRDEVRSQRRGRTDAACHVKRARKGSLPSDEPSRVSLREMPEVDFSRGYRDPKRFAVPLARTGIAVRASSLSKRGGDSKLLPSWASGVPVLLEEPRATGVHATDECFAVELDDGREIHVPLEWAVRLRDAPKRAIENVRISADGQYINWPDLGEDMHLHDLLYTRRVARMLRRARAR